MGLTRERMRADCEKNCPLFIYLLKKQFKMLESRTECYIYIKDGKELFTGSLELAHKRADEGTEIKVIKIDLLN